MKFRQIKDSAGNGHYSLFEIEDFEFVDPVRQISSMFINSQILFEKDFLRMSGFPVDNPIGYQVLKKRAIEEWKQKYQAIKSVKFPKALISILTIDNKKDQIKVLKGLSIDSEQLLAFLITAGENFGYLYSQYRGEHLPRGLAEKKLPTVGELQEDGKVVSIGTTDMTAGQIKQSIEQRHVAVSRFLDKGNQWHCFFLTYKSLGGKENYKGGQPHLHYISNTWGLTRNFVVAQLKSKNYQLPSLPHIDFETKR